MLRLMMGKAGTGKTTAVIEEIRALTEHEQGGTLLLVPEQYSHEAERELCRRCGDSVSRYAEVFSFSALARRILSARGGAALPYLDKGGRLLCMALAVSGVGTRLKVYGGARRRSELPGQLLAAIDEMKTAGVDAEDLLAAAERCGGALADKLRDLALVSESYEAVVANGHADPLDRLTKLAEKLPESGLGPENRVYIDGFTDFTHQELQVIGALLRQRCEVTVCLTLDDLSGESEIFSLSRRSARQLLRLADECGVRTEQLWRTESKKGSAALRFYGEHVFSYASLGFEGDAREIELWRADSVRSECEFAAARALALVRGGSRWRDIAIAVRGFEDYRAVLESVFRHYGVPLFLTRKSELMAKPLPALIGCAYELLDGGWDVDTLIDYLHTGLTGLTIEECDTLENYVFKWQLRAALWERRGDWKQHPDGYGAPESEESRARLETINALRRRVAEPLLRFKENAKRASTAAGQAAALSQYFEDLQLPDILERRAGELWDDGHETLAQEYRQLWDLIVSALEQAAAILGDTEMDREGFGRLFTLMLGQYDIGSIPVALDRVSAGDFDRMRRRSIRHLIVLGAADDRLPMNDEQGGLLSGEERRELLSLGIDLGGAGENELWREFSLMYNVLTLPSETLTLTCPLVNDEGSEQRPAFLFNRAQVLFDLPVDMVEPGQCRLAAPGPVLTLAAQNRHGSTPLTAAAAAVVEERWPERAARLDEAASLTRGRLTSESVEALYGRKLHLSASRIDSFSSCRFAYFCRYGLKAEPYKSAGFEPPEIGTFLHAVLEHTAKEVKARGGFRAVSDEELRGIVAACVADYVHSELGDLQEKSERFIYFFRRLEKDAQQIVADMAEELRRSDFEPLDFELDFAHTSDLPPLELGEGESQMRLTGIADRVDGWLHEGKIYLRVVDYKTGKKEFSLEDVWYGMGLQMLLYLFALNEGGEGRYGAPVEPAGIMYIPARNAILSLQSDDEADAGKKRADALRRSGLVCGDEALIEAWERGEDKRFIPIRISRGKVAGGIADLEELGLISRHIRRCLGEMARELHRGSIDADPYYRSAAKNACLNCDFFAACHFTDGENGERCRYLPKLSDSEALEKMREEESHG